MFLVRLVIFALVYVNFTSAGEYCKTHADDRKIYPNPANCSQFIMCQGATDVFMECPAGLIFNCITLECDWPANGSLPNDWCDPPTAVFEKEHYCDCSKYVYCMNGIPSIQKCAKNHRIDVCNRPQCKKVVV
ncbi:peritrophin-1-like [Diabrotica virgifera virgifera]|uniref:Peritrophin-1-like n=1 Tax=Diabrotica virgifera virgifera TaxID=50390 RepID=A0A6P7FGX8_DIAVI|nr:peritrophin-1-like [Diabrotica virgifera virgifera]